MHPLSGHRPLHHKKSRFELGLNRTVSCTQDPLDTAPLHCSSNLLGDRHTKAIVVFLLGVFLHQTLCGIITQNKYGYIPSAKAGALPKGLVIEMMFLDSCVLHVASFATIASVDKKLVDLVVLEK